MKLVRTCALTMIALACSAWAQAVAPPAKNITLHLQSAPAKEVLAEIQKQTGYTFKSGPAADSKLATSRVNLDVTDRPFWEVLAQLCDPLNLRPEEITLNPPAVKLTANAPTWKPPFFFVSGPVAISLGEIRRTAQIEYGVEQQNNNEHVNLAFDVYPEPAVQALSLVSININRCVDDTGFPIAVSEMQGSRPEAFPGREPVQLIPQGGTKIAEIEGAVILRTSGGQMSFPFTFQNIPLPHVNSAAQIAANKPASAAAPLPVPSVDIVDFDQRINDCISKLASTTPVDRLAGRIGLAMLPPAGLPALDKAAARKDLPPTAVSSISAIRVKQKNWLQTGAKHEALFRESQAFQEKLALDTYARLGMRGAWDQKAVNAIHGFYAWTERTDVLRVQAIFEEALSGGCEDPLVLSLAARAFQNGGADLQVIYALYERARDAMTRGNYPAVFRLWNAVHYDLLRYRVSSDELNARNKKFFSNEESELFRKLYRDVTELWPKAAHEGMPLMLLQETAFRVMRFNMKDNDLDPEHASKTFLDPLVAMKPGEEFLIRSKGIYMVDWAWQARGGGTIDTVTDNGYKLFQQRLAEAETLLTKAYQLDPNDSTAAAEMITVCMGRQHPRQIMEQWYSKAMTADPTDMDAANAKLQYLRPQWYGSVEAIMQFSDECYRSENWRSGLPFIKASKHKALTTGMKDLKAYYALPEVWIEIKAVYEPYLLAAPDDIETRSAYCLFACRTEHWEEANKQFQLLGNHISMRQFDYPEHVKQWQAQAANGGKPAGKL